MSWQNEESQNSIMSSGSTTIDGEQKRVRRRTEFGLAAGYVLLMYLQNPLSLVNESRTHWKEELFLFYFF